MNDIIVHIYPVSLAIREYLIQSGEASPSEFYHMYKSFKDTTSLQSTYRTFYVLKRLNLIEIARTEQANGRIPKTYYKIIPTRVNADEWNNPQRYLYPKVKHSKN